jgi:CheY-like chemotaxis protein
MTSTELERVFTAFSQGDHALLEPRRYGGLGLGLAISRQLMTQHSGHIDAKSEGRDKGSTFTIELPLTQAEDKNSSALQSRPAELWPKKSNNFRARFLLVKDHEPTRTTLTHLLVSRNYNVLSAGSIAQAREIAAQETIDFVISDIGLPDGNGNELMKGLRESHGLKGVALAEYGTEEDIQEWGY